MGKVLFGNLDYTKQYAGKFSTAKNSDATAVNSNNSDVAQMKLERVPDKDIVCFSKSKKETQVISFDCVDDLKKTIEYSKPSLWTGNYEVIDRTSRDRAINLQVKNRFLGGKNITGSINNHNLDINIVRTGFFNIASGKLVGQIDGKDVCILYSDTNKGKALKLVGNLDYDYNLLNTLAVLITDNIEADIKADEQALAAALAFNPS